MVFATYLTAKAVITEFPIILLYGLFFLISHYKSTNVCHTHFKISK